MKDKAIKYLEDKEFLSKLYGYAYKRCSDSHEAKDLCSDIVLAILKSVNGNENIESFYAYAWNVARRVYSDFCEKRRKHSDNLTELVYENINISENPIERWQEKAEDGVSLNTILTEISFLSKIYRQVMIMYYLDEIKLQDIARVLSISETAVKQRLFSARKMIRNAVSAERTNNMNINNPALKPIRNVSLPGAGNPCNGNDPRDKFSERLFSTTLIYLCKDKERSAAELSEIMNVPTVFIEEELEIQANSGNGYGALKKLDNGKYINNIMILNYTDLVKIANTLKQHYDSFADCTIKYFTENKEKILSFPHFASEQKNIQILTWILIHNRYYLLQHAISEKLVKSYFKKQETINRIFNVLMVAARIDENVDGNVSNFNGCDGTNADDICGYERIFIKNMYGKRLKKHFWSKWDVHSDQKLKMLISSINGIDADKLDENESEIAAKAIEEGYIRKENNKLVPNIIVVPAEHEDEFFALGSMDYFEWDSLVEAIAADLANIIKKYLSKHLMYDYKVFAEFCFNGFEYLIESCIEKGVLNTPEKTPGVEGIYMSYALKNK